LVIRHWRRRLAGRNLRDAQLVSARQL
jgi:hypothetical protein